MSAFLRKTKACLPVRQGFTLIEMVVVVAIIGITSALIITSLTSTRSSRETERAIHTLAATLREAQNYALTGRSTSVSQENCFYAVRFMSSSQYALVNYYRSGGNCNSYNTISTTTMPSGTTISGLGTFPTIFAFSLPRAEVYSATSGALASLGAAQLIGATKGGQTHYLCLYPGGRVEERGVVATCP